MSNHRLLAFRILAALGVAALLWSVVPAYSVFDPDPCGDSATLFQADPANDVAVADGVVAVCLVLPRWTTLGFIELQKFRPRASASLATVAPRSPPQ